MVAVAGRARPKSRPGQWLAPSTFTSGGRPEPIMTQNKVKYILN